MSYIEKKLNSFAGEAITKINDIKSRKRRQQTNGCATGGNQSRFEEEEALRVMTPISICNSDNQQQQQLSHQPVIGFAFVQGVAPMNTPFGLGDPYGGDSNYPPQLGFVLNNNNEAAANNDTKKQRQQSNTNGTQQSSSESLYAGDFRSQTQFQRIFFLYLIRLLMFISKLYQDFHAVRYYNWMRLTGHFLISASVLSLPTVIFTLYRVARYLQIRLPQLRIIKQRQRQLFKTELIRIQSSSSAAKQLQQSNGAVELQTLAAGSSEMSSKQATSDTATVEKAIQSVDLDENDGLVTARQTPTSPVSDEPDLVATEFTSDLPVNEAIKPDLATPTRPDVIVISAARQMGDVETKAPVAASATDETAPPAKLESFNLNKMGTLPDSETTGVVLGSFEQLLHGILFIFWQLKRQVDVLSYLVVRACLWRAPAQHEQDELTRLQTGSDGLEWFQDFYGAFLAIILTIYTMCMTLLLHQDGNNHDLLQTVRTNLRESLKKDAVDVSTLMHNSLAVKMMLKQADDNLSKWDLIVAGQVIVSAMMVLSLLVAVRRRDDGPMTWLLGSLGWGSLFVARIIVAALAFVQLEWRLMFTLIVLHVLAVAAWIYKISLDSHDDKPSERLDEAIWDEEVSQENGTSTKFNKDNDTTGQTTGQWTILEHMVLLTQILVLFALPSLFYWPIMFNLKNHLRPFKYLLTIMVQNFLLVLAIWYSATGQNNTQLALLGSVGLFSILGFLFITLYIVCKPDLTEYFAQADMQFNQAEQAGIYYEFCARVFKMPDLKKHSFKRLLNQGEQEIEEEIG